MSDFVRDIYTQLQELNDEKWHIFKADFGWWVIPPLRFYAEDYSMSNVPRFALAVEYFQLFQKVACLNSQWWD